MSSAKARTALLALVFALGAAALAPAQEEPLQAGGEGVPVPKKTKHVQPVYPPEALAQGIRGIVILDIVIDARGKVSSTSVLRSVPGLDEAAIAAARQWEYEPTKIDNKPVSGCWGIGFKLSKNFDTLPKPTEPPAMQCFTPETGAPWYGQWKDPDSKIEQKGNTCYKPPHPVAVACKK